MDSAKLTETEDETDKEPSSKMSLNDLPAEILLKILAEVSDVSRGMRMYIFDFPKPAAVCQRWFNIYFEMYYKRWGFLHGREALLSEWRAKVWERNVPGRLSQQLVQREQSALSDSLAAQKPKWTSPFLPKAVLLVKNQKPSRARSMHRTRSTSAATLAQGNESINVPDINVRDIAIAAAKSATRKATGADKGWQAPTVFSKRKLRKRSQDLSGRLLKRTLPLRRLNWWCTWRQNLRVFGLPTK